MEAPSYPTPPDPKETAAAQTTSNKETAVANANLNRINQYTPQGSVEYTKIGTNEDGTPQYRMDQRLSAPEQAIYDTNAATRQNIGTIGQQQSQRIGNLLGSPVNLNNAAEDKFNSMARARLDPLWADNEAKMRQKLADQGIMLGSEAYDRAMGNFNQSKNDAYNSMFLQGRGQAVQEAMAERNQPINEISALLSGSQVSQPNFMNAPTATMANTDVAGIYNNAFNQQMQIANAQNQSSNAMMGGLAGIAGNAMKFIPWSDRRLKTDVKRIGVLDNGLPVYTFKYIWGGLPQVGVMAQDVEAVRPDAIVHDGGFMRVDYSALGLV